MDSSSEIAQEATEYEGHDPLVGQTLGKYKIIDRVARGGTATVYRAMDEVLKREVAVKILHQHLESRSEVVERFRNEAQTVASLRHPNILNVFDFFNHEGRSLLVAEFMPGYTLSSLIRKVRRVPENYVLMLGAEILRGLREAHDSGFTHRDIKPANILLHENLGVKISDFGLAKLVNSDDGLTKEGVFIGTPSFSSPEQIEGKKIDHRTDLFSLGLSLYMMATGYHAFKQKGDSTTTVWFKIVRGKFQGIREIDAGLSLEFEKILDKALQVDPEKRYSTALEMLTDVHALLKRRGELPYTEQLQAYLKAPFGQTGIERGTGSKLKKLLITAGLSLVVGVSVLTFWSLSKQTDHSTVEEVVPVEEGSAGLGEGDSPPKIEETEPAEDRVARQQEVESPAAAPVRTPSPPPTAPPPPPTGARSEAYLPLSSTSTLLVWPGDDNYSLRFQWEASEHQFRLIDDERSRDLVHSRFADSIYDWNTWQTGEYSWSVAGQTGRVQIKDWENYRSRNTPTKRDLLVSSAFSEVDLQINPFTQQIRLSWESGPGADSYRVEVAEDEDFQSLIFSGVVPNRYVQVERLWSEERPLFWRVQYLDRGRNVFFIDPVRQINLKINASSPMVDVIEPRAFQRVGDTVSVQVIGPQGTRVSCGSLGQALSEWKSLRLRAGFFEGEISLEENRLACSAQQGSDLKFFILPLRRS